MPGKGKLGQYNVHEKGKDQTDYKIDRQLDQLFAGLKHPEAPLEKERYFIPRPKKSLPHCTTGSGL